MMAAHAWLPLTTLSVCAQKADAQTCVQLTQSDNRPCECNILPRHTRRRTQDEPSWRGSCKEPREQWGKRTKREQKGRNSHWSSTAATTTKCEATRNKHKTSVPLPSTILLNQSKTKVASGNSRKTRMKDYLQKHKSKAWRKTASRIRCR